MLSLITKAGSLRAGEIRFHTLPIEGFASRDGEDVNLVDPGKVQAAMKVYFSDAKAGSGSKGGSGTGSATGSGTDSGTAASAASGTHTSPGSAGSTGGGGSTGSTGSGGSGGSGGTSKNGVGCVN